MKDILLAAHAIGRRAGDFNHEVKTEWRRAATRVARQLVRDLQLPKETYEIRWVPGGPAVGGEVVLHHERIYVQISAFWIDDCGFARSCKGRLDFTGGQNISIHNYAQALEACRDILEGRRS